MCTCPGHRPGPPRCHCLPRAKGQESRACVLSAWHRARQSSTSRQELQQEGQRACLGTEWNADTHRLPVHRRKVTSWSPGKAQLRGTSGQVPGLLALSGSSSCLAGLPSHGAEALRLGAAICSPGRLGKGRGWAERLPIELGSPHPPSLPGGGGAGPRTCPTPRQPA